MWPAKVARRSQKRSQKKIWPNSASPKPHPSKPHPCNMPQAKTEVALQFSECCAAETALQHWFFCSAEVIWTKSCGAANEKLHCNIEKAALQESGAFLPLSCGFQAPTFRHPRLGPADQWGAEQESQRFLFLRSVLCSTMAFASDPLTHDIVHISRDHVHIGLHLL